MDQRVVQVDPIIVSGGQTGADRGALKAAIKLGHPHGGWCPKGRKADDGTIQSEFQLMEHESEDYSARTEANVRDTPATLVLAYEAVPTGGTKLTLDLVAKLGRRGMFITLDRAPPLESDKRVAKFIRGWVKHHNFDALNVAGPRERKAPGIAEHVMRIVAMMLQRRERCICNRLFPEGIWENPAVTEHGHPLRCSQCAHETLASDFGCPTPEQLDKLALLVRAGRTGAEA